MMTSLATLMFTVSAVALAPPAFAQAPAQHATRGRPAAPNAPIAPNAPNSRSRMHETDCSTKQLEKLEREFAREHEEFSST